MRKVSETDLEAALKSIETAWIYQDVSNDMYYKILVEIASDFASLLIDLDRALVLVNRIPQEYFDGPMQEQMRCDHLFAESAVELAYKFQQLLLHEETYTTNQPAAEA